MTKKIFTVKFKLIFMNYRLLKFIKEAFKNPGTALDFGSGEGMDKACLKNLGWIVRGVDLKSGTDLNLPFEAKKVDLVYANYLLQFLDNKKQFIDNCFNNLKKGGRLFLHTFDKSDRVLKKKISTKELKKLLRDKFEDIEINIFSEFDNHPKHRHWHKILEVTAKKREL